MSTKLQGKRALVTGGSRGIGAGIALRLAEDGADVALTYVSNEAAARKVAEQIQAKGRKAAIIRADAADADAVQAAVHTAAEKLGGLDILVNNAGIGLFGPFSDFSLEDFDRIVAVNVRAVFAAAQAAAKLLGGGGRIITIGSVNGDVMPMQGGSLYGMSKAAVQGLTRGLARDLGPQGITVNNVQPGPIHTDLNPSDGPFSEFLTPKTALNRYGTTDEVAQVVSFLASEDGAYVTGAQWDVDGGFKA